jgi:hypothetical protein
VEKIKSEEREGGKGREGFATTRRCVAKDRISAGIKSPEDPESSLVPTVIHPSMPLNGQLATYVQ